MMNTRRSWVSIAGATFILGALSTGCMSVRLGAPKSLNPVMLGPKKHLGPARTIASDSPKGGVQTGAANFRASSYLYSSSDGAGSSAAQSGRTIENAMDIQVAIESNGNVFDVFEVTEINCNGWGSNWAVFIGAGNKCIAAADKVGRRPQPQ